MDARTNDAGGTADREIVTTRLIAAPRELVFAAWTDPQQVGKWWGPTGFTTTTYSMEVKPGGVWRFVMHGPDGRDYQNTITYLEIVPPLRLVYAHSGGDDEMEPVSFQTTVSFEDRGGKTAVTLRALFPTRAERDRVVKEHGAVEGGKQTLERFDHHVTSLAAAADGGPERDFVITRTFEAPRDLVWQAWTEPERLAQWWGPKGCTIRVVSIDLRPGGMFHYAMTYKPGHEMWGRFVYGEVTAPERLAFVTSFSDVTGGITRAPFNAAFPLEIANTLTLMEENGRTTLTLRGRPVDATAEERAFFAGMFGSMQQGFGGTFDQLAAYLAKLLKASSEELAMQKITPFLWFDHQAEDAMNFYLTVFKQAKAGKVTRYGKAGPGPEGSVLTASFELEGLHFTALNGGPHFPFTPAVSFHIACESQDEVDHYWSRLSEGGHIQQCGWLNDKFGVSWQIVPTVLPKLLGDPDRDKANRVMQAMLQMRKLDIAALQQAYAG